MEGRQLKFISGVADLAKLDTEAAGLTLHASDGMIQACYAGAYVRGYRTDAIKEDFLEFTASVSALRFKTIVGMFSDEDDVRVTVVEEGLRIRSRSSDAVLTQWGEIAEVPEYDEDDAELMVLLPARQVIEEIETAAEFVSDSQKNQATTGIRMTFSKAGIQLMAYDGAGALYQSTIETRVKGRGSIIVPTQDFLRGARLVGEGDCRIVKPNGADAVVLAGERALFRAATFATPWPDVSEIIAQRPGRSFQVESYMLRNLVTSAKTLDGGPDISVRANKGHVLFSSESESGSFTVAARGEIDKPLVYDAETLGKVTRLGPMLKFSVPQEAERATIVELNQKDLRNHRKCWVLTRV